VYLFGFDDVLNAGTVATRCFYYVACKPDQVQSIPSMSNKSEHVFDSILFIGAGLV